MTLSTWTTRPLTPADRPSWERLFGAYCRFYEVEPTPEHLETVWGWTQQGEIEALVAVAADGGGEPVGLAHLRPYVRPVRGVRGGYLDDLFVAPEVRGSGVVEALFAGIRELAAARGWGSVRWITAADNQRARAAYERLAQRTEWVTYEIADVEPAPSREGS